MLLHQLIKGEEKTKDILKIYGDVEISRLCKDIHILQQTDAYFCFSSDQEIAEKLCLEALEKGVKVVFSNFDIKDCFKVDNVRSFFARACANFYDNACKKMKMIAVCGTNGKTSTTHIIAKILERCGKKVGIIGTNGVFFDGKIFDCPLTTPDADFLHETFLKMKNANVEFVIMEVSAHAVDQKRTEGIFFDVAVLTNITHDHLDYFKSFERYRDTKFSFFTKENVKQCVICSDDEVCMNLAKLKNVPVTTYGIKNPADSFAIDAVCSFNGASFVANVMDNVLNIKTNLIGNFNILNSLAALTVCKLLGLNEKELSLGINFIHPIDGRFNVFNCNGKYAVVDFAHSPDGMVNVLSSCRELTDKKIFIVFGCGGNRDKTKRAEMGKIAEEYADYVCLTNDNPRLEVPEDIIKDIEKGMKKPHFVELDRSKAIKKMLWLAREGDVVVIAGKGAEKYQEIGTIKQPYNDFEVIKDFNNYEDFQERGLINDC